MLPPTGLIPWFSKNRGKYLRYCAASPFPLQGKTSTCSRGSKKDFWRRCRGGCIKSRHTKYPSQTLIPRITLFAICLSFSSPPLHPCHFICPLFSVRLFVCLDVLLGSFVRLVEIVEYLFLNREANIYGSSSACQSF